MESSTANIGILGAGAIGGKHAAAARKCGARVRWIVDVDRSRAEELAATCGAEVGDSPQALWSDPATTAVVVGVPNKWHAEYAIAAFRAGKDVLLEKPMAASAAECRQINDAAAANSRVLQIGFAHRYTSVGKLAKQLVDQGRCGRIYHAQAQVLLRRGVPGLGKWFTTKSISGGGALIDVGVHLIDLALFLMGYPQVTDVLGQTYATFGRRMNDYVYESMWAGPPDYAGVCDVEDAAHAFVRFRGGATLQLAVAWAGNFPEASTPSSRMGFFGDAGGMTFELFGNRVLLTEETEGKLVDRELEAPENDFYADQFADFLTAVAQRRSLGPTGAEGEIVQAIVDQIYRGNLGSTGVPQDRS